VYPQFFLALDGRNFKAFPRKIMDSTGTATMAKAETGNENSTWRIWYESSDFRFQIEYSGTLGFD
jgi:hypothetical protein